MATTIERVTSPERIEEIISAATPARRPAEPPRRTAWSVAPIARALGWSWVVIFGAIIATEPAPANPEAPIPWYGVLSFVVFFGTFLPAMVGLFARRRWAFVPSTVAGLAGVAVAVGCLQDHHTLGVWTIGQIAGFAALAAASVAARARTRATTSRAPR